MKLKLSPPANEDVMDTYLVHRPQLVRFFAYRTGSRELAEDIVQEIALKLHLMARTATDDVQNPLAFIYRVGSNLLIDRAKQSRQAKLRDANWTHLAVVTSNGEAVDDAPAADRGIDARQRLARIAATIDRLGPQCQRAFRLHKFDGLSHGEVAEMMGISRSAVEKHISTALRVLIREVC